MMFKFLAVLACLLAIGNARSIKADDSVQIQVYYETLCPDSIAFITTQLYPSYLIFGPDEILDVQLVPYGFAHETIENGERNFTCQHGPDECYGNKVHACVINSASLNQTVNFAFCSEWADTPTDPATLQSCAEEVDLSWSNIEDCLNSGLADDLLSANGNKTELVDPVFIPTITFNGQFNQTNQDNALVSLKEVICGYIGNPLKYCRC